ncbi:uncharacterized protein LOC124264429 [Haliotis rubra]|uniref:uncharacterized protein LOC124264429 n=1 Tax=Haliotis rubra TaxID=36100 RepID=UPI001EE50EFA|nr:uncharacterized protein LOC124264429 [Haliotis rubra]XP_046555132.1 uncharacterized protein LOC124264429 [Haliotis rubra]
MLPVFIVMVIAMDILYAASSNVCTTTGKNLIAHPTKCAQYYNCSAPTVVRHRYSWEAHLQECNYPQLYNPDTQRCEHYSMVQCGNRSEPLGYCEYDWNRCAGSRYCGPPCHVYNPTCRNLSDGLNVYEYRINSSYFVVCVNQRLVYTGQCPYLGPGTPRFDPKLRTCSCS